MRTCPVAQWWSWDQTMLIWLQSLSLPRNTSLPHRRAELSSGEASSQVRKLRLGEIMDLSKVWCSLQVELGPEFLASGAWSGPSGSLLPGTQGAPTPVPQAPLNLGPKPETITRFLWARPESHIPGLKGQLCHVGPPPRSPGKLPLRVFVSSGVKRALGRGFMRLGALNCSFSREALRERPHPPLPGQH